MTVPAFPVVGGRYRHWKGGEYVVIDVAPDASSNRQGAFAVYYKNSTNGRYIRALEEFTGAISDRREFGTFLRFLRIEDWETGCICGHAPEQHGTNGASCLALNCACRWSRHWKTCGFRFSNGQRCMRAADDHLHDDVSAEPGKPLDTTEAQADHKVFGNVDAWKLIYKVSSESQRWTQSTKAMEIAPGVDPDVGCLVQVSTEIHGPNGPAIAETLTFVPDVGVICRRDASGEIVERRLYANNAILDVLGEGWMWEALLEHDKR